MRTKIIKWLTEKKRRAKISLLSIIGIVTILIAACVPQITSVDQPATVNAGDSVHMVMHCSWQSLNIVDGPIQYRYIVGVCQPKSWNGDNNTSMRMESTAGTSTLSLIPPDEVEPTSKLPWKDAFRKKFGIGPNLIDDVEWVAFWSDKIFTMYNGDNPTGNVFIAIKTSQQNLQYKPGYAFCENVNGFDDFFAGYYTNTWTNCLQVLNGTGDLQDFCNPQIGVTEPSSSTKNDITTFKYDSDVDTSALKNENEIYLCATAYTTTGQTIAVCNQDEKSSLVKWGLKKWRLDIWPAEYFGLSPSQELSRIEYYFTNKTGSIRVGFAGTEDPFKHIFKCE